MKKSEYITFRTTIEIKEHLEKIATEEDRTISYVVNRILLNAINNKTEMPKASP